MKVRFTQPVNLEGREYRAGDEANLHPQEALAMVRGKYAVMVQERAVAPPKVEVRADEPVEEV
jgi:hypothetical protein